MNNNTTMVMKSTFDSGNWSKVTGLPDKQDISDFMEHLTAQDPNKCFSRRDLMDAVAKEFNISATLQEVNGPGSSTPQYYTRITYLITDAIQGKGYTEGHPFLKRLSLNVYQNILGSGVISKEFRKPVKVSKRLVDQARVSVKLLKNLAVPHGPEQIMCELGGRVWSDDVIETAINLEFGL